MKRWAPIAGLWLAALTGCSPGADEPPVWFELRADSGIDFRHRSGHQERYLFPEIIGGGAALADLDGDGDLDAYLVQGGSLVEQDGAGGNRLFENVGDGSFRDVTRDSGAGDEGYGMGVAAGDYDGDGDIDLYVTNLGPNVLLQNLGDGRFVDATEGAGVGNPAWGASAAFLDYDRDGDLDLFVANYVNWAPALERDCYDPNGLPDYCLPTNYDAPAMDCLYRNEGDGTFRDVTLQSGLDAAFGNGLGVVVEDFDGDGWTDIFVANDGMMNQLWLNRQERGFVEEALLRGCALDEQGLAKAGMGVAVEDYDVDGDPDLLVVNLQGETDSFFANDGSGYFTDGTAAVGLAAGSRTFTRFGVGWIDFDHDGRLDLFQANGRVQKSPEPWDDDAYAEPNLLFRGGPDGRLVEVVPRGGVRPELVAASRAAAFGDVDGDGGVDVLIVNRDGPAHLLRNVAAARGQWIRFRVVDRRGGVALGAAVTLTADGTRQSRSVRTAYSFFASNDPRVHFGLGRSGQARDVEVRWPDGTREAFGDLPAGGEVELRQGSGRLSRP